MPGPDCLQPLGTRSGEPVAESVEPGDDWTVDEQDDFGCWLLQTYYWTTIARPAAGCSS